MFIAYDNSSKTYTNTQSFPALSSNPIDVSGAGDSLHSEWQLLLQVIAQ